MQFIGYSLLSHFPLDEYKSDGVEFRYFGCLPGSPVIKVVVVLDTSFFTLSHYFILFIILDTTPLLNKHTIIVCSQAPVKLQANISSWDKSQTQPFLRIYKERFFSAYACRVDKGSVIARIYSLLSLLYLLLLLPEACLLLSSLSLFLTSL